MAFHDPLLAQLHDHHNDRAPPVRQKVKSKPRMQKKEIDFIEAELERERRELHFTKLIDIRAAICSAYGFTRPELVSSRRTKDIVRARHIAFYIAKKHTTNSYPLIGRFFGDRDHTTVMHGVRKIERELKTDPKLQAEIAAIAATLSQKEAA